MKGGSSNNTGRAVISITMMIAGLHCDGGVRALVTASPSHRRASGASREKKVRLRPVIGAEGVFEIHEALLGWEIRAELLAAPFGDRMHRGVLQELRPRPFDECVRHVTDPGTELLDEPRLAETRLTDDQRELPVARPRALPAAHEMAQLLFAADEGVRERAQAGSRTW